MGRAPAASVVDHPLRPLSAARLQELPSTAPRGRGGVQPPLQRARTLASSKLRIQEQIDQQPTSKSRPSSPAQADAGHSLSLPLIFLSLSRMVRAEEGTGVCTCPRRHRWRSRSRLGTEPPDLVPGVCNSMPPPERLHHRRSSRGPADAEIRKDEEARREREEEEETSGWLEEQARQGRVGCGGEWRREVCRARRLQIGRASCRERVSR